MGSAMMKPTMQYATMMVVTVVEHVWLLNFVQNVSVFMQQLLGTRSTHWLIMVSAMMKPIMQIATMMEEIAVEIVC